MSTVQLLGDVAGEGVLSPVQNPPPDPNRPTLTPMEAQMQCSAPRPPHAMQEEDSGVSFDQAIKGFHLSYKRFRETEAAYFAIRHILQGKREPPIIRFPTGQLDEQGEQIVYEMDLTQTLPRGTGVTEDARLDALRKQLVPWNNYLVEEYVKWCAKMLSFLIPVNDLLAAAQPQQTRRVQPQQQMGPVQQVSQVPPVPGTYPPQT